MELAFVLTEEVRSGAENACWPALTTSGTGAESGKIHNGE